MGIVLGSQFSVQTALPLDDRDTVADNTARDAINSGRRYIGFKTFSIASLKTYQLQTGITNSDWVDISASTSLTTADTLTAFAGGGQASALALTAQINRVTTVATAGDSVKLPAATAGAQVMVINAAATNSMDIFPVSGEAIDSLGANIQYPLTVANRNVTFVCVTAGTWISKAGGGGGSAGFYVASGSKASPTAIASVATIPYDYTKGARQVYFLTGTGGETLAGVPQIAAGTTVGYEMLLIGCDDTNYLRFFDANGMSINGEMYLYNKCSILLFWDGSNWFETSRSSR